MGAGGSDGLPSSSIPAGQGTSLSVSTPMTSLNGINGTGPDPSMLDAMSKVSSAIGCFAKHVLWRFHQWWYYF